MSQDVITDNSESILGAVMKVTGVSKYWAAAVAYFGGLSASDIAMYGGFLATLIFGIVNVGIKIYFARQRSRILREAVASGKVNLVMDDDDK